MSWTHICAETYRQLVNSMSYPGDVYSIHCSLDNPYPEDLDNRVLLMSKMLLDREVTFRVIEDQITDTAKHIKSLTAAVEAGLNEVDYVFLMDTNVLKKMNVLSKVKQGSLTDPHDNCTLFVLTDDFSKGKNYLLQGPGIRKSKNVKLPDVDQLIKQRQNYLSEFPMGVDMIFLSSKYELLAIPRTTCIKEIS